MPATRIRRSNDWVLVAIARDNATAEEWQQLLADAHIDAELRLADPAAAGMPSSIVRPWATPTPTFVSYPLYVRQGDRAVARRIIRERGGLGGMPLDRAALVGALVVVGLTLLVVAVAVL